MGVILVMFDRLVAAEYSGRIDLVTILVTLVDWSKRGRATRSAAKQLVRSKGRVGF